jgi:short-subunit dehydrogenase
MKFMETGQYKHIAADLGDLQNIEIVWAEISNRKAETVVINAADFSVPENDRILARQLNLNFAFPLLLIQRMLALNGTPKIIFISSIMAYLADGKTPAYGAAKAALSHYIDGISLRSKSDVCFMNVIAGPLHEEEDVKTLAQKIAVATYPRAARIILESAARGRREIYVPGIWKYLLATMHLLGKKNVSRLFDRIR